MKRTILSIIIAFCGTVGGLHADAGFIPEDEDGEEEFVELLRNDNGAEDWEVDGCSFVTDEDGSCYWAMGYNEGTFSQTILLGEAGIDDEDIDLGKVVYQASAMVKAIWGCRIAEVTVEEQDENGGVLNKVTVLDLGERAAVEEWESYETSLCIPTPGTRQLRYVVRGRDKRSWAGLYGPCFKDLSLKAKVIKEVNGDGMVSPLGEPEDGAIYNLAGQRLSKMQKGINIVGDKKVLIK